MRAKRVDVFHLFVNFTGYTIKPFECRGSLLVDLVGDEEQNTDLEGQKRQLHRDTQRYLQRQCHV